MKKSQKFVLWLFLIQFSFSSCFETCEESTRQSMRSVVIYGTIDSVFLDESNRNQPCVLINSQKYSIYNEIYQQFSKGDIIIKYSGSMKYYWVNGNDTTIFYPKCGSNPILD
ncbi:MAG TPA: hypothetical protein PKX92_01390 [Edaphocola sp.]|nr:hypothetical protein [Edaphocola sp.]